MRVWILICGAIFFGVFTAFLAKAAIEVPSGWVGFNAFITGIATFAFVSIAADEAR